MTEQEIKQDMALLAQRQRELERWNFERSESENAVKAKIQDELTAIEVEFEPYATAVSNAIATITERVKAAVLEHGRTVSDAGLMVVWSKGRVSWDTAALDGYAAAHPELAPFRKEGKPSVSIRSK